MYVSILINMHKLQGKRPLQGSISCQPYINGMPKAEALYVGRLPITNHIDFLYICIVYSSLGKYYGQHIILN